MNTKSSFIKFVSALACVLTLFVCQVNQADAQDSCLGDLSTLPGNAYSPDGFVELADLIYLGFLVSSGAVCEEPQNCPADINGDGLINVADTNALQSLPYYNDADGCPAACAGDFDFDGNIGFADLLVVLNAWGSTDPIADISGPQGGPPDGIVNVDDLVYIIIHYGPCA